MSSLSRSGTSRDAVARGARPQVGQAGWWLGYAVLCCTFIAALPTGIRLNRDLTELHLPDRRWTLDDLRAALDGLGLSTRTYLLSGYLLAVLLGLLCLVVAGLVVWRKPGDRATLVTSVLLAATGWSIPGTHLALEALYPDRATLFRALGVIGFSCLALLVYLFPSGTFVPRWTRWVALLMMVLAPLNALDTTLNPQRWPAALDLGVAALTLGVPLGAQVYRYRRVATAVERQQIKWVVTSLASLVLGSALLAAVGRLAPDVGQPGVSGLVYHWTGNLVLALLVLSVPLTVGISVLRFRLWDVDPLLNRTLVYGALTLLVGGAYVAVYAGLTTLFRTGDHLLVSVLAAGASAVLFDPARRRLQRLVNRLTYGERDDPYSVLTRLARRLDGQLAPEHVLRTVAQSVTEAFRVPATEITVDGSQHLPGNTIRYPPTAAQSPTEVNRDGLRLPLRYRGERLGWLSVAPRGPGETFSSRDRELLADLARHAGAAVYTVRAGTQLQRARERLVIAGHEERRRLRRDLHDGLGPLLATLGMKLEVARELIDSDQQESASLVEEVRCDLQETLGLVRRLVHGLYPPVLDQLGLLGAIRESAQTQLQARGVAVELVLPDEPQVLPAATEVAVYYIAVEAIQNVQRHSSARSCRIRLGLADGRLKLEVQDDGLGRAVDAQPGVGLSAMQERARAVGGSCEVTSSADGTKVRAVLPTSEE